MPLIRNSKELPEWSELTFYNIIKLAAGTLSAYSKLSEKEMLFVCKGECEVIYRHSDKILKEEDFVELEDNQYQLYAEGDSVVVLLGGNWSAEKGSCGVFSLDNSPNPGNKGDKTDYNRTTDFDNHFHDCDEYWIIADGRGLTVSENKTYEVNPGDCIATKAGDHHDFPEVYEKIKGVWFETTLKGLKRKGHLWNHTHINNL